MDNMMCVQKYGACAPKMEKKNVCGMMMAALLLLLCAVCVLPVATATGDGTVDNPYVLTSVADLKAINDPANLSKNYILSFSGNPLEIKDESWEGIGNGTHPFTGTFNENGYVIMFSVNVHAGLFNVTQGSHINTTTVVVGGSPHRRISVPSSVMRPALRSGTVPCPFP